jgi:hypothetical protein
MLLSLRTSDDYLLRCRVGPKDEVPAALAVDLEREIGRYPDCLRPIAVGGLEDELELAGTLQRELVSTDQFDTPVGDAVRIRGLGE